MIQSDVSQWDQPDGLVRGMDAVAAGGPISVPVGENTLGRMFNVLGDPIDEIDPPAGVEKWTDPQTCSCI